MHSKSNIIFKDFKVFLNPFISLVVVVMWQFVHLLQLLRRLHTEGLEEALVASAENVVPQKGLKSWKHARFPNFLAFIFWKK